MGFLDFFSRSTRPRAKSARRGALRHRRARFEPLEDRTLLSVTSPNDAVEPAGPGGELVVSEDSPLSEPNERGMRMLATVPALGDDGATVVPGEIVVSFLTTEVVDDFYVKAWWFAVGEAHSDHSEDQDTAILDPETIWETFGYWEN